MAFARLNCVPPEEMENKPLMDEYRELPRVIKLVRSAAKRGETVDHPATKTAVRAGFIAYGNGVGHLRFFYPKCQFLYNRQRAIIAECRKRGLPVRYQSPNGLLTGIPEEFYGDWKPTYDDIKANREILKERSNDKHA